VPIYQFLTLLNLWIWLVWGFLLFRLSRMNLKLVATHPDTHGGLGFLGLSPGGFAPIAFALSLAIGANWRNEILNDGARLADFWLPAAILAVVIFLIALAPLAAFVPKLVTLRRKGILEYGTLAQTYVTAYHEKWISHRSGQAEAEAPITKLEANTLTDLTFSYDHIRRMRPFPIDRNTLVGLALSVAVPLFPVVLAEIPASVILRGLIDTVKAVPL
jgi:hypothetical protein